MARLKCPRCKSSKVQLIDNEANIKKTKKSSSLNLNPLKPFTVFNHKEKKVKKKSKGKIAMAIMTGGTSTMVTGLADNKSKEFYCTECGKIFKSK